MGDHRGGIFADDAGSFGQSVRLARSGVGRFGAYCEGTALLAAFGVVCTADGAGVPGGLWRRGPGLEWLGRGAGGRRFSEHVCASGRRRRFGAGSFCRAVRVSGVQGHASGVAGKCWRLGAGAWFARRTARGFRAVCGRRGPGGQGCGRCGPGRAEGWDRSAFAKGLPGTGFQTHIRGGRFAPGASSGGGRGVFAAAETGKGPGHKKFALSCKENPVFS